ncbi:MAG: menaquinone biosynthetic enzyme MqnA/MqnD family protein [Candidatus Methylacidiphilales bacterium]
MNTPAIQQPSLNPGTRKPGAGSVHGEGAQVPAPAPKSFVPQQPQSNAGEEHPSPIAASSRCRWRIGSVPYLNAKPLVSGLESSISMAHPTALAAQLRAGELDAALAPIMECIEHPNYEIADGFGICCEGEVHSVFLHLERPLEYVRTVAMDAASKTSAMLTRVVLADYGLKGLTYLPQGSKADAHLWIGDQALAFRERHPHARLLDLGQAWLEQTDLPFVFAVWALRTDDAPLDPACELPRNVTTPCRRSRAELAETLRATAVEGLRRRRAIARNLLELTYLTRHIQYDIGPREKRAAALFATKLAALGLIPTPPPTLRWI